MTGDIIWVPWRDGVAPYPSEHRPESGRRAASGPDPLFCWPVWRPSACVHPLSSGGRPDSRPCLGLTRCLGFWIHTDGVRLPVQDPRELTGGTTDLLPQVWGCGLVASLPHTAPGKATAHLVTPGWLSPNSVSLGQVSTVFEMPRHHHKLEAALFGTLRPFEEKPV